MSQNNVAIDEQPIDEQPINAGAPSAIDEQPIDEQPIDSAPTESLGERAINLDRKVVNSVGSNLQKSYLDNPAFAESPTAIALKAQAAVQHVFDWGGDLVAEKLATAGANPYVAASAGMITSSLPDIALSAEAIANIKISGIPSSESSLLSETVNKIHAEKLDIPYPQLTGPEARLQLPGPAERPALPAPQQPLLLGAPKEAVGPSDMTKMNPMEGSFKMTEAQGATQAGKVPEYVAPENLKKNESLIKYGARKKLNSEVPDFQQLNDTITDADKINPTISEVNDNARTRAAGGQSKITIEEGETATIKPKNIPQENRVVSEPEVNSAQQTAKSKIVRELDIPASVVDSSSLLPGSDIVPVLKDTVNSGTGGFASFWNRVGRATEDVIASTPGGTELANDIRLVRDVPAVRYGDFASNFDRFFQGMSRGDIMKASQGLADALEGRAASKLPEGLLEYTQDRLAQIANEADEVGLKITNSKGEVMPFAPRERYFPKVLRQDILDGIISGDDKILSKIAEKMVENRQEPNFQVAFERTKRLRSQMMLNKYGHLERAREIELPAEFYDTNALRVIPEYIKNSLYRLEETRRFGGQGELALEKIDNIAKAGGDHDLARRTVERFTRIEPRDTVALKAIQGMRNITAGMLVQFQSTIQQTGQFMTPAFEAGFTKAATGFVKAFTALGDQEAARAGILFQEATEKYLGESYGGSPGIGSDFANGVFKITGFSRLDHFLRKYGSIVGRDYIENSLVPKILGNPNNKMAIVELEHLGYDPAKIVRNRGLSDLEVNVGAKRFADNSQGSPNVTTLPLYWTSPMGKLFSQFKTFAYVIGRENLSLVKRGFQTGNLGRIAEMGIGIPAAGYAIKKAKEAMGVGYDAAKVTGKQPIDEALDLIANSTTLGPALDLFMSTLSGKDSVLRLLVPTSVNLGAEVLGATGQLIKGNPKELQKTALKRTPVVGKLLYNQAYPQKKKGVL